MTSNTTILSSNFSLHLPLDASPERLFAALTTSDGIKSWWTKFCEVSETVGGLSSFRFPKAGFFAVMKTMRLEPARLVEWECIDSAHNPNTGYADLHDWIGTRIRFEIHDLGHGKSRLDFTHSRLDELECRDTCRSGWAFFLGESLRDYLEKDQGQPWTKE